MDSLKNSIIMEEYELMKQPKYRVYMSNIDKALKNFEYSSEWADLISALGKLNKVISSYNQYQIIPRRIKISKRLAQCMHPALPSGVHLRALETYDAIFSNTGVERLATELFIYSAGLFPLLGYAAMNVRPTLLSIYEKYFVPLGERLRPALSGFLSGVLPGYEAGLDHFERTNSLLNQVCTAVSPIYFYTCLWECVATNASIRLPAVSFLIDHFNKKLGMIDQNFVIGKNHDVMMAGLCACLNDSVILVQRNTLEFLLSGFPMHTKLLSSNDLIKLVTSGLNTILRRDMSLNRRLYSWLLGADVSNSKRNLNESSDSVENLESYFDKNSKHILTKALRCTLKSSLECSPVDLSPYRILVSLLDKVEIGPVVLDDVLCDVIRTMSLCSDNIDVAKSANLLFATFDPAYIWNFMTQLYEKSCKLAKDMKLRLPLDNKIIVPEVDSGPPSLSEVCYLTEFLLETISLEMYNETTRVYLPKVFLAITQMLTIYSENLSHEEVTASLKLCMKIVSRVQPMITSPVKTVESTMQVKIDSEKIVSIQEIGNALEKSKSDSKINQTLMDDEPIKRSNSNQNMSKKSPKKAKKSKSYSKLLELDKEVCSDTGQLVFPSAISTPNLDFQNTSKKFSKNKKTSPKSKQKSKNKIEPDMISERSITPSSIDTEPNTPNLSEINRKTKVILNETTMQEYSILEKCIKQYEIFYQVYVSRQVLQLGSMRRSVCRVKVNLIRDQGISCEKDVDEEIIEDEDFERINDIGRMFDTLKINVDSRMSTLYSLLHKTISQSNSTSDLSDLECLENICELKNNSEKGEEFVLRLMKFKLNDALRESVTLASNILVEMSTFPNYNQNLIVDYLVEDIPCWLKVLVLVCAYSKSDRELQISTITTLFELISLIKSQLEHSTNPGVTFVVMLPLLKFGHINYLEQKTRLFQVLTSSLWDYLGVKTIDLNQISSLLYQLNNCLDSGLVETVIGHRIANTHLEWTNQDFYYKNDSSKVICLETDDSINLRKDRLNDYTSDRLYNLKAMCLPPKQKITDCNEFLSESKFEGFKKFELLWHLGRDSQNSKGFEKTLLKMFDNLSLPYHISIRISITKWLQESFIRGDLSRILRPLLKIMLTPNTKKISVVHAHLMKRNSEIQQSEDISEKGTEDDEEVIIGKEIYAVSSEDGNVRYHLEMANKQKRSPIRALQKKFFGVTLGSKNKTSNYISDKNMSHSDVASNISLIINPLDGSSENENHEEPENENPIDLNVNPISIKDDFYSSCEDSEESESSNGSVSCERDDSVEREIVDNESSVLKRFSGHCNEVVDVMTELDRTKNKKTYHLTKSANHHQTEKLEMSLNEINDGFDESASAEDYFSTPRTLDETINENIDESIENIDDIEITSGLKSRGSKNSKKKFKNNENCENSLQETGKRLSCTSKTSNESSNSNTNSNYSDCKEKGSEHDSDFECDNELKSKNLNKFTVNSKINWEKAKETFEKSKQNVEILRQNAASDGEYSRSNSEEKRKILEKIHPFHTHMLLYYGVYDTKQVLYSFQTLRNIISCDCRTFLCLSITTAVSNCQMKQLLVRQRKSIFGKGFTGTIVNTEFSHAYRGCMYLEALVTICLYYARSYFPKEVVDSNDLPSAEDIQGNCKIQLASVELLTLLCTELIVIIKDMGKGLACYIAELMTKCKLQKIVLHCILSSVQSVTKLNGQTFTEKILSFNDPGDERLYSESFQVQLLRLLLAVIKLEFEVTIQKGEGTPLIETNPSSQSPTRLSPSTPTIVKYLPNCTISQQPMFLSAILSALQADSLKHLHKNWTDLVTSSLSCFTSGSLTNIVISIVHQICGNIDKITKLGKLSSAPPDYMVAQLEALTVLCHYCLLDNSQQTSLSHIFNQAYPQTSSSTQSTNPGQILNNLVHVFLSTPSSNENQIKNTQHAAARNAVLSHLPRIVASVATLWENEIGQSRYVKQQLLEFLSPISLHHGMNFLAAIAVAWQERGDSYKRNQEKLIGRKSSVTPMSSSKALPQACPEQLILVKLVSGIRVMPMDSFVQTLHQVVKTPPPIHHPPAGLSLDVSALELFYFYMKGAPAPQLGDSWSSLLALLRDGLGLTPPAQFVMLAILNEFVQRCPQMPFQDKKDLRDLHDITSRLVEALSTIAGACLEQTTWLRRNLAVKEDVTGHQQIDVHINGNQQYSVQAQSVLAAVLANLLDVAYGSQEKDKVIAIVTTLMYNIIPYLKNHTMRNIPSFFACSNLLASLSGYQYTRKAWRKDILDLLLDASFLQMDVSCLPFWKSILDSLMTYDNTTFRELMNRVSLAQTGSLSIFSSREQEYEQRALLLRRLAFVIFCSELDQYHKYMPEIQEQLANSLRLPQVVPSVQAAVFLCFRVLLLRMSQDNVTSLWPIIISEMVQVFLAIEQELMTDTEEYNQHIKMLSGLDSNWVTNSNNGLHSHGHPNWRMVQLETAKLLELGCVLPATFLPHFQMYRWAFVGGQNDCGEADAVNGEIDFENPISVFVPHVTRIARLMDFRYTTHSPKVLQSSPNSHLVLTCQSITNLQDLYSFFSTLGVSWPSHYFGDVEKDLTTCLAEIETVLAADFLEKMPSNLAPR